MKRRGRRLWVPAARAGVLALAALGAGCGDDGDDDGDGADGGAVTSVAAAEGGAAGGQQEWCQLAVELDEGLDETERLDVFDAASLEELYRRVDARLETAADAAPDEIRDDVATLAEGFTRLVEVLEQAGWDIARISATDLAVLDDPRYLAAADRIDRYGAEACGLAPGTTAAQSAPGTGSTPAAAVEGVTDALIEVGFEPDDARCVAEKVLGGDASRVAELFADPQALADACGLRPADVARILGGG